MFTSSRFNRRDFLTHSSLVALAPTIPAFLNGTARAAETKQNGRILVVLQLSGGNDGINTIVPYSDESYANNRDKLRLPTDRLIKVNDEVGLHPALRPAADLLEDGRLAIVQGVGYPNPNRSHDVSMAIWQTARFDPTEHKSFGWIGRAMDDAPPPPGDSPHMILLGDELPPVALQGRRSTSVALAHLQDLKLDSKQPFPHKLAPASSDNDLTAFVRRRALDAYATSDLLDDVTKEDTAATASYPSTRLAARLSMIAQLIKAGFGTSVYYTIQSGYDTHAAQLSTHARLLGTLGGALKSFLDDLKASRLDDRVIVLCFSEFGRRVKENASLGTDHGTAGPVFLAGPSVKAGMIGDTPNLANLEDGDLKMGIDFRQVYASVLEDWLGLNRASALKGSFSSLPIFRGR